MLFNHIHNKGFTLVETLVGAAVFVLIAVATYKAYAGVAQLVNTSQYRIAAINLANEQIEIIRNLPYADIGIPGSIPDGKVPYVQNFSRSGYEFIATTTIRNLDLSFDGTIGSTTNDLSPADNKTVEIEVGCSTCSNYAPIFLTTQIAPKNLETASTNGALFVKVFDASGAPVSGADVRVTSTTTTIVDTTNTSGILGIVDVPPKLEAYTVEVSKSGYSSDRTYSPITVLLQQLTQVSFSIDKVSQITFSSVTDACTAVPSFDFMLKGSKKISTNPDVFKYDQNLVTNGSGQKIVSNMEWDTYTITANDGTYDAVGLNPLNPFLLVPNTDQVVKLIVAPKNPKTLLVTVKDSTLLPLSGATVTYGSDSSETGRGSHTDTDWSDGLATTDGNIDYTSIPGEFKLVETFGSYVPNGTLESKVFDTGSASYFQKFLWRPEYQPVDTGINSVYFQIATAASSTGPWTYRGPDGTTGSYYTSSDATVSTVHNGGRYIRYKAYMSTVTATTSPIISDVSFTFTTECTPPGQVLFSGLTNGTRDLIVSKTGYATVTIPVTISNSWQEQEVLLGQ
jgi:prepilin-type N-terminal cleavage/methylation domain-containing protein